ncbi:unnamed protein product [Withania somnifera]
MEVWFIIVVTLCISFFLKYLFISPKKKVLPPGTYSFLVIGSLLWARRSFTDLEPMLHDLKAKYGPLITLNMWSRPTIFVASHSLAYQALVQQSTGRCFLQPTKETLHPSRIKAYSKARSWVLGILLQHLRHAQVNSVRLIDHFLYAMFCLLVLICLGDKPDESQIKEIENIQHRELIELRQEQENIFVPLIEAQSRAKEQKLEYGDEFVVAYVDTLLNLELPEEKRNLNHGEIVTLCKITSVVEEKQSKLTEEVVKEEDLQKMPYLKAVILEGFRRHPPGHFVVPHTVTEEVELNGYVIPKDATINFMVADMGLDPKVWEDPLEFKPERFLVKGSDKEDFDITGSREIKMIPFGAGRRISNLVWHFQWKAVEGDDADLSEKQEFTVVMKNPLRACICPRVNSA